ncbi:ABC transporter ATP-binding protein [Rhizobium sp. LEGMi135b]
MTVISTTKLTGVSIIPPASQPVLSVKNLKKKYLGATATAVDDVSFDVAAGEIVALLGPSGCGKTTTMRIVAGLEDADDGDVLVDGVSMKSLPPYKRNLGLVFQDLAIFPHMTVEQNVAFGLRMRKVPRNEIGGRVEQILKLVELPADVFGRRLPSMLSGGQRQRVALARSLVVEPKVVLLDEPMSALDQRLRDRLIRELRDIHKRLDIPAVYVTHDQEGAAALADRIAVMGNGKIHQNDTAQNIYDRPNSLLVAEFFGELNCIPATIVSGKAVSSRAAVFEEQTITGLSSEVPLGDVNLCIRPSKLVLSTAKSKNSIGPVRLQSSRFISGQYTHVVCNNSKSLEVLVMSPNAFKATAEDLWLDADPSDFLIYRREA